LKRLESTFATLREFPMSGPSREFLAKGLRVTFQRPYAVYYLSDAGTVLIVRVLHGARDHVAIAEQGGFSAQ
jgi:toxin ParE1/3/4